MNAVHAQDLIVTDKGDSLNCKITKVKEEYIYFTFKYDNEIRNTLLPFRQVKFYRKDFYSHSEVPADKIKNMNGSYQRMRLGVYGGWSYETAKVNSYGSAQIESYLTELKSGHHWGADFTYFTSEHIGFGLRYTMFRTKNQLDEVYLRDTSTGQTFTSVLRDNITVNFIGPAFTLRLNTSNKKVHYYFDFALGYLSYKDDATLIKNFTLTGETVGSLVHFDVDVSVSNDLSLGFGLTYLAGSLREFNYEDGGQQRTIKLDDNTAEGLSRFDLSIALRWNK